MKTWFMNFFNKQTAKDQNKTVEEKQATQEVEQSAHSPELTVTIRTEYVYVENEPVGQLSHLDFGKPSGELGCFLNYEPRALCPPTEKQLNYLKDLGVFIPDGITKEDASCMISRATGEDSEKSPHPSIVALASGLKIEFSAFIGASGLFCSIIHRASQRDRAALYAYAVRQNMRGRSFGNMLEDPKIATFYAFADQVITDPALMRSLEDRPAEDYKKPHRGTAIYKAAAAYLTNEQTTK